MRLETSEPSGSDVRASIDSDLTAGEGRRTDTKLRVGAPAQLDADGLRATAAQVDQGGTGYGVRLIVELAERFTQ
jgi:hypothetical protein